MVSVVVGYQDALEGQLILEQVVLNWGRIPWVDY
jgi:hypothetical protein